NGGGVVSQVNVEMRGGKQLYTTRAFVAGPALEIPDNTILTVSNYYALTFNYVDTDVLIYGPNTTYSNNYYLSGFAFTTPDTNTTITALGTYNDCMFGIMSTQDAYLNTIVKFYDAVPGANATEMLFIEDRNMVVTEPIVGESRPLQSIQAEFVDTKPYMPKGSKFEVYHNDDPTDSSSFASVLIGYLFEPPVTFD
ncbi:unnamed protein product, partial [marine sediment metagenome]